MKIITIQKHIDRIGWFTYRNGEIKIDFDKTSFNKPQECSRYDTFEQFMLAKKEIDNFIKECEDLNKE